MKKIENFPSRFVQNLELNLIWFQNQSHSLQWMESGYTKRDTSLESKGHKWLMSQTLSVLQDEFLWSELIVESLRISIAIRIRQGPSMHSRKWFLANIQFLKTSALVRLHCTPRRSFSQPPPMNGSFITVVRNPRKVNGWLAHYIMSRVDLDNFSHQLLHEKTEKYSWLKLTRKKDETNRSQRLFQFTTSVDKYKSNNASI